MDNRRGLDANLEHAPRSGWTAQPRLSHGCLIQRDGPFSSWTGKGSGSWTGKGSGVLRPKYVSGHGSLRNFERRVDACAHSLKVVRIRFHSALNCDLMWIGAKVRRRSRPGSVLPHSKNQPFSLEVRLIQRSSSTGIYSDHRVPPPALAHPMANG